MIRYAMLLFAGLLVLDTVSCAATTQHQVVAATATAAVAADLAVSDAFDAAAEAAYVEVDSQGVVGDEGFEAWCAAVGPTYEVLTRIECAITDLGRLVLVGGRLVESDPEEVEWLAWFAEVAPVVGAILNHWTEVADPPPELVNLWDLLRNVFPGAEPGVLPTDCAVGPVPGC